MARSRKIVPTEHQEQALFFDWIRARYPTVAQYAVAVPNQFTGRSNQMRDRVREGLAKGYPDVLIDYPCGPYHGMRIEMKRVNAKPSETRPEQKEWIERLAHAGYYAVVCKGADAAMFEVEQYLASAMV